jgi:Cupin-like domain
VSIVVGGSFSHRDCRTCCHCHTLHFLQAKRPQNWADNGHHLSTTDSLLTDIAGDNASNKAERLIDTDRGMSDSKESGKIDSDKQESGKSSNDAASSCSSDAHCSKRQKTHGDNNNDNGLSQLSIKPAIPITDLIVLTEPPTSQQGKDNTETSIAWTPERFFLEYVSRRKPCVIHGLLQESKDASSNGKVVLFDVDRLRQIAGDDLVQVEVRPPRQALFGASTLAYNAEDAHTSQSATKNTTDSLHTTLKKGKETMTMREFLDNRLQLKVSESESTDTSPTTDACALPVECYYLNTQDPTQHTQSTQSASISTLLPPKTIQDNTDNDDDATTPDSILDPWSTTPCKQLKMHKYLPESLLIAGNLLVQSVQVWLGRTMTGSTSSGLHHDFHDNIYVLLQGRKQFRIFAPTDTPFLYNNPAYTIHANGLISYDNNPTRVDGVPLDQVESENENVARIDGGRDTDDDEYSNDVDVDDDDDDEEEEEVVLGKGFDYESDTEDDDMSESERNAIVVDDAEFDDMMRDDDDGDGGSVSDAKPAPTGTQNSSIKDRATALDESPSLDHFSPIDLTRTHADLLQVYPLLCQAQEYVVEIKAGEALYLPASWWHFVTSMGGSDGDNGVHLAVNYFYHPPSRLDCYDEPYEDSYWSDFYKK